MMFSFFRKRIICIIPVVGMLIMHASEASVMRDIKGKWQSTEFQYLSYANLDLNQHQIKKSIAVGQITMLITQQENRFFMMDFNFRLKMIGVNKKDWIRSGHDERLCLFDDAYQSFSCVDKNEGSYTIGTIKNGNEIYLSNTELTLDKGNKANVWHATLTKE